MRLPTAAPPRAALPPQTKLSEETKAMSELEEIDRRGDEPVQRVQRVQWVAFSNGDGSLPPVPHTQSPRRGPPGAAAVPWDSPAQSNQRSSLIVAQPILLCSNSPSAHRPPPQAASSLPRSTPTALSHGRYPPCRDRRLTRRLSTLPPSRRDRRPPFLTPTLTPPTPSLTLPPPILTYLPQVLYPYISHVKQLIPFKDEVVSRFCQGLQLLVRAWLSDPKPSGGEGSPRHATSRHAT